MPRSRGIRLAPPDQGSYSSDMQIAIIGTGNVGGALARAWARAGHRIFLGVRNLQDQKVLALTAAGPLISAHTPAEAVSDAETVLFAIPPNALRQVLDNLGDLKGKVLIDATNSVRTKAGEFASVADALRSWTKSADVVKCFNTTGFNVMENPQFGGVAADMFMAGSSSRGQRDRPHSSRGMRVLPNATTSEAMNVSHFLNPLQASGSTSPWFKGKAGTSLSSCSSDECPAN